MEAQDANNNNNSEANSNANLSLPFSPGKRFELQPPAHFLHLFARPCVVQHMQGSLAFTLSCYLCWHRNREYRSPHARPRPPHPFFLPRWSGSSHQRAQRERGRTRLLSDQVLDGPLLCFMPPYFPPACKHLFLPYCSRARLPLLWVFRPRVSEVLGSMCA